MRSAPSLMSMMERDPAAFDPALRPVVKPWEYMRLRREAAGLSVAETARPYWSRPQLQAATEEIIRSYEQRGFRLHDQFYAADRSRAFPFSVGVYRALCEEPPHRHPRLCLACGWDRWTDQLDAFDQAVTWSEFDPRICTLCDQLHREPALG